MEHAAKELMEKLSSATVKIDPAVERRLRNKIMKETRRIGKRAKKLPANARKAVRSQLTGLKKQLTSRKR